MTTSISNRQHFSPESVISTFADVATWSGRKLGDGCWMLVLVLKDDRLLEVEELATSWKVIDVSRISASSASSLELALKKADVQ